MLRITAVIPDLSRLAEGVLERVDTAVAETALAAAEDAKASMLTGKSGRIYRRGTVGHQASAPGETPAIDTGDLIGSITTAELGPMEHAVTVGAEYAVHLEYGTRHMEARPFLRPALERSRETFIAKVGEALK
jgi:HK97 gp10 family phage protein